MKSNKILELIMWSVILLIIVVGPLYDSIKGIQSDKWHYTNGSILESELKTSGDGYEPHILYSYSSKGVTYTSDKIRFGSEGDWELVGKYSKGKKVTVYYNPNNPAESILENGLIFSFWSIIRVVIGLLLMVYAVKEFLKKEKDNNSKNQENNSVISGG